ncbi:FAD binding domain protein [Lasiodiplodia theobromae]|uniref:FAD binding domain protein n=1 Tax=Lasiodiplodia theobromae TaxID=45133 RepID=UPI0015C2E393|nr:FAD binding domain protein [Lasiodiplodia theobromae]KAF4540670.1 FAD binding domain protein [Lasiodiplodia theobromae]
MSKRTSPELPIIWRSSAPEAEYEAARCRVFNAIHPDRYPDAIVKPTTVEHIQEAVKLAKKLGRRVAIRSGGHSWACWSIRNDSILIDLIDFRFLAYDENTKAVQASPSTTGWMLTEFLTPKGRFFPGGHCGDVALGGFLLQGGMGLNSRSYGWACEYITAIDVITADGELKHCDRFENADLYWAARGAGPGFPAIVTKFYMETRPFLGVMKKSTYTYPMDQYDAVMAWLLKIIPVLSEDVEPILVSSYHPVLQTPTLMVQSTVQATSDADALAKLKPLIDSRPPAALSAVDCEDSSFAKEYSLQDNFFRRGCRVLADDVYLDQNADMISVCRRAFTQLTSKWSSAYWEPMNPVSRRPLPDMALSLHTDHYIAVYAVYEDASEDSFHRAWVDDYIQELEKHSFWSDEAGKRLMNIRKKWDPTGRICGYLTKNDKSGVDGLPNVLNNGSVTSVGRLKI